MPERIEQLNKLRLGEFPNLYTSLEVPTIPFLTGRFYGTFLGPGWLRAAAGSGLLISGLRGWWRISSPR
jgi:hypothetical protein